MAQPPCAADALGVGCPPTVAARQPRDLGPASLGGEPWAPWDVNGKGQDQIPR